MAAVKFMLKGRLLVLLFFACIYSGVFCQQGNRTTENTGLKKFYKNYSGCFILLNLSDSSRVVYNNALVDSMFSPASTFKICNSLIALETGVANDTSFALKWDGVKRQVEKWNANHTMAQAFRNSTVWFYQELARRIGPDSMLKYLSKIPYGNFSIDGGIDQFWLTGGLRISPNQQIEFIRKLVRNQLPFSIKNLNLVKSIMVSSVNKGVTIHSKTGWGTTNQRDVGWYVGYVEKGKSKYVFCNLILNSDFSNNMFASDRIQITYKVLQELGIINLTDIKQ